MLRLQGRAHRGVMLEMTSRNEVPWQVKKKAVIDMLKGIRPQQSDEQANQPSRRRAWEPNRQQRRRYASREESGQRVGSLECSPAGYGLGPDLALVHHENPLLKLIRPTLRALALSIPLGATYLLDAKAGR